MDIPTIGSERVLCYGNAYLYYDLEACVLCSVRIVELSTIKICMHKKHKNLIHKKTFKAY